MLTIVGTLLLALLTLESLGHPQGNRRFGNAENSELFGNPRETKTLNRDLENKLFRYYLQNKLAGHFRITKMPGGFRPIKTLRRGGVNKMRGNGALGRTAGAQGNNTLGSTSEPKPKMKFNSSKATFPNSILKDIVDVFLLENPESENAVEDSQVKHQSRIANILRRISNNPIVKVIISAAADILRGEESGDNSQPNATT